MRKIHGMGFAAAVGAAALLSASVSWAAPGYTLSGGAVVADESVSLVSSTADASTTNDWSAISFSETGVTTFSTLTALSTDFNVTDDDCSSGSPRFQVALGSKNVFVYLGPLPNYTGCDPNTWTASGNLITSTEPRFDLQQFDGNPYSTYAEAVALVGSQTVTGISLVADSGWASAFVDHEQTVLVDNVVINGNTFAFSAAATATPTATATTTATVTATPTGTVVPTSTATPTSTAVPTGTPGAGPQDKDDCKKGGWQNFSNPSFKNQGQCVSSVASNKD